MIYFLCIYAVLKLYIILDIYQQSHYSIKEYSKFFICNFLFYDLFVILCSILGLYADNLVITLLCGLYIILYALLYFFVKVKLKISRRIIRMFFLFILYIIGVSFIPYVGAYLLIGIEFSSIPVLWIEQGISKVFNYRYIVKAKHKIDDFQGNKVMITGSYGKTSTKLLFQQVLNIYESSIATPKSFNTPLGISKFINETCIEVYSHLILEYGASKVGDIEELCRIATPDIGVVCEIGLMHVNGFKTMENIIKEKMKLIKDCRIAILNYDNEWIRSYPVNNEVVLTYGFTHGDFRAKNVLHGSFDFYYKENYIAHFDTQLVGEHQILNLLAPLSYVYYKGYDLTKLKKAVNFFKVENNRLELKCYGKRVILDDAFNSNLKGFIMALKELGQYSSKRILLTPGIVELGKYRKQVYSELVEHIIANSDIVILVGYKECKDLYELLRDYGIELYMVRTFKEGYSLYSSVIQSMEASTLLIENDLPDIYRRGLGF